MIIDFHSHILPGIDDGSAHVAQSIKMLHMEAEQGITHVVATPHFYARHNTPEAFLHQRDKAEAALREEMAKHSGLPQIHIGAEVSFFRGMADSEMLEQLVIRGTNYILVEMPMPPWDEAYYRELAAIWEKRKLTPIIAHIDRYIGPFRTRGIPQRLAELPVLVQANADFFRELGTASMALRMLRQGHIHLLGSDCHNTRSRKPNLGDAIQRIARKLGQEPLDRIREYGQTVLDV